MRRDGAFRALLVLLVSIASAAAVLPPENVRVSCQNTAVTVRWNYPEHQPKTRFRVTGSIEGKKVLDQETNNHHYDLTHFVWNLQKNYLEYLIVQVTALQGNNQSEKVNSNSFSFNQYKSVDTKCSLDFPPVEIYVKADGEMATVSFSNPITSNKEVLQTFRADSRPLLKFEVSSLRNGTNSLGDTASQCSAEDICRVDVPLPEDEKLCVKLNGDLFESGFIRSVKFRETNETCALDSDGSDLTLAVILTAVVFFLIIMAVFFICKVKAWTTKTSQLPSPLILPEPKHEAQKLIWDTGRTEDISEVRIVKPSKRLSTTSEDSNQSQSHRDQGAGLNPGHSERALYAQRRLSESSNQTDSDSADCSVKTDCVSIESEGEETAPVSPYDCPHVHMVDMGDGDMVTGYGGN